MRAALLTFATVLALGLPAITLAQTTTNSDGSSAISPGGFVAFGIPSAGQPTGRFSGFEVQVGFYIEWPRGPIAYGFTGRAAAESLDDSPDDGCCLAGTASQLLLGPRVEFTKRALHPYAEALFGKANQSNTPKPGPPNSYITSTDSGFGVFGAIGLDIDQHSYRRIRIEYSIGGLTGTPGVLIQTVSIGYLVHFP